MTNLELAENIQFNLKNYAKMNPEVKSHMFYGIIVEQADNLVAVLTQAAIP